MTDELALMMLDDRELGRRAALQLLATDASLRAAIEALRSAETI